MQNVELPHDLTNEERDAALLQLLEVNRRPIFFVPSPTEEGTATAKALGEMLHSDVAKGRIEQAIWDAAVAVESSVSNAIFLASRVARHNLSNEFEHVLSYNILTVFDAEYQELPPELDDGAEFVSFSEDDSWIGDPRNSHAFAYLMTEIKNSLPELIRGSMSCTIDNNVIRDGLSNIINGFIDDRVVPIIVDSYSSERRFE